MPVNAPAIPVAVQTAEPDIHRHRHPAPPEDMGQNKSSEEALASCPPRTVGDNHVGNVQRKCETARRQTREMPHGGQIDS